MASMTLYLPAPDFSAFHVHVSRLAWHTQDMAQDGHVALSIAETDDRRADPFTADAGVDPRLRLGLFGSKFGREESLAGKIPEQAINFELADFSFWRIVPKDARFIAGFGRIHNLSAEELKHAAG